VAKKAGSNSRGAFKVDTRICITNNGTDYDLANIEYAKSGDVERKCASDLAKTIVEGTCILDSIAKIADLSHEEAKKVSVLNLQFCGKVIIIALIIIY
jgi:hypothetical protein